MFIFPSVWTKSLLGCVYTLKSEVTLKRGSNSQYMGATYPVISFDSWGVNQLFFIRAPEMSAFVELFLLGSFLLRRLTQDTLDSKDRVFPFNKQTFT